MAGHEMGVILVGDTLVRGKLQRTYPGETHCPLRQAVANKSPRS
jgi:hypothetical protein